MKTGIHPTYHAKTKITCTCGAAFAAGSTVKEIHTEICSQCHPFYTGKQKLVDTAGKVDKFRARLKKAESGTGGRQKQVSDSVKTAAAKGAARKGSAVASKTMVKKVKASAAKRDIDKAKKQVTDSGVASSSPAPTEVSPPVEATDDKSADTEQSAKAAAKTPTEEKSKEEKGA